MDRFSDSSRCDLDSVTSGDSLHLLNDEFQLRLSTPDLASSELSKQLASLELENERLRVNLETLRIELNSKIAANQGLKDKITEFYVDAQSALQDKLKLENNLKDTVSRLASAENSTKWYQQQLHGMQANQKTLQIEIGTYKELLRKKQQTVADVTIKCKQVNQEYADLVSKFREEKGQLHNEINNLRLRIEKDIFRNDRTQNENEKEVSSVPNIEFTPDLSEATEGELRETKAQLKVLEQRLLSTELSKISIENAFAKHCALISSMEDNMQRCEKEKNELAENLMQSRFEVQKLRSENEAVQFSLMASRQNQSQVEEAINQLQTQLSKMIAQFKVVKTRNSDLEEKVTSMQGALEESKRLKLLSFNANSSLLKKLKQEKRKVKRLEGLICQEEEKKKGEASKAEDSVKERLKQALDENKELKEQLKSMTRISEESIDEGYADGISLGLSSTNLPSPLVLNPVLLMKITDILSKSKHLMSPIQLGVNKLQMKIEKFKQDQNSLKFQVLTPNSYNNRPISTVSSPNNTRTLV